MELKFKENLHIKAWFDFLEDEIYEPPLNFSP